jgi:hypothetical protein
MFAVHRVVLGKIVEDWMLMESLGIFQHNTGRTSPHVENLYW